LKSRGGNKDDVISNERFKGWCDYFKMARMTKALKRRLGFNDSALHWDLVNTEDKTVTALLNTGKRVVIYEKEKFTY